ncbi:uncharacterized protein LOC135923885 isoform X2 [Gordionus sp. m RMFG-2023]|uniref:uncharacterized protein LOC135923885 isoform X2 n=1 Tax=Gordionus sp. m RMFG-2023 TaxID=3053472 RepID=UPI0031FC0BBB
MILNCLGKSKKNIAKHTNKIYFITGSSNGHCYLLQVDKNLNDVHNKCEINLNYMIVDVKFFQSNNSAINLLICGALTGAHVYQDIACTRFKRDIFLSESTKYDVITAHDICPLQNIGINKFIIFIGTFQGRILIYKYEEKIQDANIYPYNIIDVHSPVYGIKCLLKEGRSICCIVVTPLGIHEYSDLVNKEF